MPSSPPQAVAATPPPPSDPPPFYPGPPPPPPAAAAARAASSVSPAQSTTSTSQRRPHPPSSPEPSTSTSGFHAQLPAVSQLQRSDTSQFKRARTTSPPTDDASSEADRASVYSEQGADSDTLSTQGSSTNKLRSTFAKLEAGGSSPKQSRSCTTATPSPYSQASSVSSVASSLRQQAILNKPISENSNTSFDSQDVIMSDDTATTDTVQGNSVDKLSLDDAAATLTAPLAAPELDLGANSLPSYSDAMQQTITCHTPDTPGVATTGAGCTASAEELRKIKELKDEQLAEGQRWYLVDRRWYANWQVKCLAAGQADAVAKDEKETLELPDLVDASEIVVGPITARPLLNAQGELKLQLQEGVDFELLPELAYSSLAVSYGEEPPQICRNVIQGAGSQLRVEMYPPKFFLHALPAPGATATSSQTTPAVYQASILSPLSQVKFAAKRALLSENIADSDIRFWRLPALPNDQVRGHVEPETLKESGIELVKAGEDSGRKQKFTLADLQLDEAVIHLAVEQRGAKGWLYDDDGNPAEVAGAEPSSLATVRGIFATSGADFISTRLGFGSGPTAGTSAVATGSPPPPPPRPNTNLFGIASGSRVTRSQTQHERSVTRGLTGLQNLGNTCFMASALQCMSNTRELKEYFVSGVYREEINEDNPLGMGGAVARAFGELLTKLWSGTASAVHPREFKQTLSRFSPQFIGYAQQDTQELLAFLLDGLHEDLNRIKKKPYVEAPDWEGGDERDMVAFAKRQWEIYKMRNDSVIVDLFQGQYRSTLVCPECSKVSIKFDPFMYLTLPIPNRRKLKRKIWLLPADVTRPTYEIEIQGTYEMTFGQAKERIGKWFNIEPTRLICADVFNQSFYRFAWDYEPLSAMSESDTMCLYELPCDWKAPTPEVLKMPRDRQGWRIEEGKPPVEPWAILPVFSQTAANANARAELFGLPFLIALPQSKVNDVDAVRDAILQQYVRYALPDGVEMLEGQTSANNLVSAEDEVAHVAAVATTSDWEMVEAATAAASGAASPTEIIQPSTPAQVDGEGVVAEINTDGEVKMVPDEAAVAASTSDAAPAEPAEVKAAPAARPQRIKRLFTMTFINRVEENNPIPKKSDFGEDLEERWSGLAQRAADAKAAALSTPPTTVAEDKDAEMKPASPVAAEAEATAAADAPTADAAAEDAATANPPWPLVYTGSAIVCQWPTGAYKSVFDGDLRHRQGLPWGPEEKFIDPELAAARASANDRAAEKPKQLTIDDCLDEFTKEEKLGAEDPWYCPQCKDFRQATKKFELWKVPDILVVHLKRFSAGRSMGRDKIEDLIDFPIEGLDLGPRVEGAKAVHALEARGEVVPSEVTLADSIGSLAASDANDDAVAADAPIYDLYAVDNHFGGLGGGHYTAYAMNPEEKTWHYFDDSSVSSVADTDRVKSKAAYLLFYRRRTTRSIGGKSRELADNALSRAVSETGHGEAVAPSLDDTTITQDADEISDVPFYAQDTLALDDVGGLPYGSLDSRGGSPTMPYSTVAFNADWTSSNMLGASAESDYDADLRQDDAWSSGVGRSTSLSPEPRSPFAPSSPFGDGHVEQGGGFVRDQSPINIRQPPDYSLQRPSAWGDPEDDALGTTLTPDQLYS